MALFKDDSRVPELSKVPMSGMMLLFHALKAFAVSGTRIFSICLILQSVSVPVLLARMLVRILEAALRLYPHWCQQWRARATAHELPDAMQAR